MQADMKKSKFNFFVLAKLKQKADVAANSDTLEKYKATPDILHGNQ